MAFTLWAVSVSAWALPQIFSEADGDAIGGYDPVTYFTEKEPVRGDAVPVYEWKGAVWHFVSVENLERFVQAPEKFAPQYGGWCAAAMAQGKKAASDPLAWSMVDGKLYLHADLGVREAWAQDARARIAQADREWDKLHPWEHEAAG
jgi:hypothetical protein